MPSEHASLYPHVLAAVLDTPWAILDTRLSIIAAIITRRIMGERLTPDEIQAEIGAARPSPRASAGTVAVIPIFGVISQRVSMMSEMSGGTSTERIGLALRQAVDDPNVGAIVLQIDSPGGGVYGVDELATTILKARGSKPIVAIADAMAASAAYWIASAADEISVTPSGEVGSIGIYTAHEDVSRMADAMGVTVSLISAGKYKTEGSAFAPLGDEARSAMQGRVDDYYRLFTGTVAKGRGVGIDAVRSGFGEGRMVTAQEAVKLGMADRVETMDQLLARLSSGRGARNGQRAEDSMVLVSGAAPSYERASLVIDTCGCTSSSRPGSTTWIHLESCPNADATAVVTDRELTAAEQEMVNAGPVLVGVDTGSGDSFSADLDLRRRRLRSLSH